MLEISRDDLYRPVDSCGMVAFGNGGWSSHVAAHERRSA